MTNFLARFIITSFNVASKALKEAYANVTQGAAAAQSTASATKSPNEVVKLKNKIQLPEARLVLGVDEKTSEEDVNKRFEYLFEANSPAKGNSFYLQSKIVKARDALAEEFRIAAQEIEKAEKEATVKQANDQENKS